MSNDNNGQNKILILQLVILVIIVVFFFINRSSTDASFKNAYKDAEKRLQRIDSVIDASKVIISRTKTQLDSLEGRVQGIKGAQRASVETVDSLNRALEAKVRVQQTKINELKKDYAAEQAEKKRLAEELSKLGDTINADQ